MNLNQHNKLDGLEPNSYWRPPVSTGEDDTIYFVAEDRDWFRYYLGHYHQRFCCCFEENIRLVGFTPEQYLIVLSEQRSEKINTLLESFE